MRTLILLVTALHLSAQLPQNTLDDFRAGELLLKQGSLQAAGLAFSLAAKGEHQPPWTEVWSHIELGRVYDLTGQRDRAVSEYKLALDTKDNTYRALDCAEAFLLKAPSPDEASPFPDNPNHIQAAQVIERIDPEYTNDARLAQLEGTVVIAVSLNPDASIAGLRVVKPLGLGLDEAALDAVRRWRFSPGADINVNVNFRLPVTRPGWHATKVQFASEPRPALIRALTFNPKTMSPELDEEAQIDAAVSRKPTASVSMEIDPLGVPAAIHATEASLPIWGDDAVRAISEWRFTPTGAKTSCEVELAWFAPK